ncbi:MAG: hypothetical protein JRM97_08260 [Nitrososphaerota archaeon]|nr:hypothetical protein [Nitrososphaerota archaeon]MDG6937486.1 hypothetical protein [Nitrososphaerota archaeon]MDG6962010.1 hypothetical protein [Nitrososphaerota archaeon]MDG6963015.1 hypothetical protein [Nitrososphaerota archaeon]MDG6970546.1 hypothetical protein [Nitrososphaerota archaeon]
MLKWSFAIGVIPPVALVLGLALKSLFVLDYVHVITGGSWTGFDIYTGIVLSRILRSLEIPARVEVAKRLTPTTFFIIPSLAAVAITSGIYLAQAMGKFNLGDPWILAAGAIVVVLTVQGFGVFLPNGVRIFLELAKVKPDPALISKLTMRNVRLAASQAIFQVLIILVMAHLAVY